MSEEARISEIPLDLYGWKYNNQKKIKPVKLGKQSLIETRENVAY